MTEELKQAEPIIKYVDHIGVFENFVRDDFCDTLVEAFEYWYKLKYTKEMSWTSDERTYDMTATSEGQDQFASNGGHLKRKDKQLYLEVSDPTLALQVSEAVGVAFEKYVEEYRGVIDGADPLSSWTVKLQKTEPGGGYHKWHCENGNFLYRDRVLTWMIYLNDVPYECGGGTDFLHQKFSLQPKKGTVVVWPACYTHMHRGAFLSGDANKYIATGWFLREPGEIPTNHLSGRETSDQLG
tara:strand:- start:506 stop:1225 length:720 start_codon:yes stop_codon:yes gene_type:complete